MPPAVARLFPFLAWRSRLDRLTLRADAIAGIIGALVVLPQGVAYASLAGLPPQFGLYCAIVPAIVAALWGSSWHLVSGPTNALSLVVLATVAPLALPGSPDYIGLVLTLTLLVGVIQFGMGLARLGALVNFISHTVIVGFTAGAAILIVAAQLPRFFGVAAAGNAHFFTMLHGFARGLSGFDAAVTATGVVTLAAAILSRRLLPKIPYMMVAMIGGSVFAYVLNRLGLGAVPTVGALPSGIPEFSIPSFDPETWASLAPAALALTVLGLTEAVSIARAIAQKSRQRIDGNQEFIGQGLSNIAGAFFSAYPSSGSFNRSGVNYEAGARTPLAAVAAALFLVVILFAVAPLAAYLPHAVMAALLFVVAWGLIDFDEMRRVARTSRGDLIVLVVTFVATLTIALEVAIFVGMLASLFFYLNRTTHPSLTPVAPDPDTAQRRFVTDDDPTRRCPQLDIRRVDGSLFFGAVEHVRDEIEAARRARPEATHLLLIGSGINFIDVAGCECLAQAARYVRESGATLHLCNLKPSVLAALERGGFMSEIGAQNIHATKGDAIRTLYRGFDVDTCRRCTARIFTECDPSLPDGTLRALSADARNP